MKKILVLAEGQTEEDFVKRVLDPHLQSAASSTAVPVVLKTKRVKSGSDFKGGVTSVSQVLGDLRRLLGDSSAVAVTTVIDYYGLPANFPGMESRPASDSYARVAHIEAAFFGKIPNPRFIPHLTLHEYEAWVFSDPQRCAWVFDRPSAAGHLESIRDRAGGAERINETPSTCPSRQLLRIVPTYQKPLDGPMAVEAIGLPALRAACPHANAWLARLEGL